MHTILIGYDLNRPGQDYDDLFGQIKEIANGYWHHLDSTWLIRTEMTPKEVCDSLKEYLDSNDELLVINVTGRAAAWTGFSSRGGDWLHEHL